MDGGAKEDKIVNVLEGRFKREAGIDGAEELTLFSVETESLSLPSLQRLCRPRCWELCDQPPERRGKSLKRHISKGG